MPVLGIFMSLQDSPGAVVSTTAGKFDAAVCDFAWWLNSSGGQGRSYTFVNDEAAGNVVWYHFAQISDAQGGGDDGFLHRILDSSGNEIAVFELFAGLVSMKVTGSTSDESSGIAVPTTLTRFDVKVDFTTGIAVDVYLDGGAGSSLSASVASAGTRTKPIQFIVQNNDADDVYVSELYAADFDTRNTRPVKQVPDASGNYSAWIGGHAELGDEDILTAVVGEDVGDKLSVNLTAYPGPASPAGISRVVVKILGSKGSSGPGDANPFVRIGSTDYSAGDIGLSTTVLAHYAEWLNNPATSNPWATADLDTTEIGLEVVS